ncbi:2OG-Fe dioxygenase family protein [Yersinia frederiksenii]|uniref:2OG-Fe dioxygenase family protein n=1 Tax=Yersinia frederiksenii TaxID=29484 RepID=UPI0005E559E5|nr:2OG-Fe dioxygenase family protein [Yersinia frederiksenii]CNL96409.1 Uncharacterized protein conserved in bacteria [Yersinia frederiksenii]
MENLSLLNNIKEEYQKNRSIFIPGHIIRKIILSLKVDPADFTKLESISNHLISDPTLPFRKTKTGRFCFNFKNSTIERIEFQPFVLSAEEDFVRHDSGETRCFRGIGDDLQLNTVFQALMMIKAYLVSDVTVAPRPKLNQDSHQSLCTVFNLRTVTTPILLGEPSLEGVHSDGADHTMTIFLGSKNMSSNSAKTFVHDMKQKNGLSHNEIDRSYVLKEIQHKKFLDTLLFVDHERKHSLTPIFAQDKTKEATRDMLIMLTRKPVEDGHISFQYDSFLPHREIPLTFNMIKQ